MLNIRMYLKKNIGIFWKEIDNYISTQLIIQFKYLLQFKNIDK